MMILNSLVSKKFHQSITIFILSLTLLTLENLVSSSEQDQQANEISSTATKQQLRGVKEQPAPLVSSYNVPFLVLMSGDEISVAQFPLIENGRISVAYRLAEGLDLANSNSSQEKEREGGGSWDEEEEEEGGDGAGGDDHDGSSKAINADAREYEQQMPPSPILGKSGAKKQRIAAAAAASLGSKFISGNQEEVDTSDAAAAAVAAERIEGGRSGRDEVTRPRRSNNLTGDHGNRRRRKRSWGSSSNGTTESNNNGTDAKANAVMESSSSSNVTSAQFSTSRTRIEQATNRGTSPEGDSGDDKIGALFSDFDVHMALGYAFVSDSTGRIHRFRFGGGGLPDYYGGNSDENLMENDYTNTIDVASKTGADATLIPASKTTTGTRFAPSNRTENDVTASSYGSSVHHHHHSEDATSPDDAANKVSPGNAASAAAAHRQSGRHPTASGLRALPAERGKVSTTTNSFMVDGSESGTPISDNPKSDYNNRAHRGKSWKLRRSGSSKPRIIWSRTKYGLPTVSLPSQQSLPDISSSSSPERKSVRIATGAFPQPPNNQQQQHGSLPVAGGESSGENQMANDTVSGQHMGSVDDDDELQTFDSREEPPTASSESGEQTSADAAAAISPNLASNNELQRQRKAIINEKLRTKIAVDWLNNLLFVLDKYRLLVVDFDGDNELVLIDDFNINNRPIDIKVDPINGFLFWLQVGTFRNTIYKLDLGILSKERNGNTLKSTCHFNANIKADVDCNTELLALISHHYAHPIITNLPKHAKIFTIDHKHSKIYVPLAATTTESSADGNNKTQRDDAEVFVPVSYDSKAVTHMNSTFTTDPNLSEIDKQNCNTSSEYAATTNFELGQVLAYNLDGTDVGPLRGDYQRSHLLGFEGMQDITYDSDKGLLYWLTNDGKEIFEEIRSESDSTFSSGQHLLDGKNYLKLKLFDNGSNQPSTNIRQRLILVLPGSTNRQVRSDKDRIEDNRVASSLDGRHQSSIGADVSRFSRNAPFIILGITCLVVLSVYLVYAFVFQRIGSTLSEIGGGGGSMGGSSIGVESRVDSGVGPHRFIGGAHVVSRWLAKPSSRSTDNSNFNRDFEIGDRADGYDIESTNYNASNAIDQHYREVINDQALLDLDTGRLANLGEWPTNLHDMSNKLYVPVEVLQDEALSSINRISIDQLEIERRSPLGEGHFGTVLQGTITCKINDKSHNHNHISNTPSIMTVQHRRSIPVSSSTSSGHGSSSTSSDFVTATSCAEATNGDYLTPKSHCTSTASDYLIDNATSSRPDSCSSYTNQEDKESVATIETKFKVAIKKLKDNASIEEKKDFLQEAKLLANFNHPNIVHFFGVCLDRGSTLIVMELMLGGDLIRYMQENTPRNNSRENLTDDDLLTICLDIVNGCCYLEDLSYVHRDLAARNCLVSSRKKGDRVVKLADFGLARDIYKDSYYKKLNDSAMPLKWMAPECLIEQKFTNKSDVWSFGVVMWEVMSYCQEKPYGRVESFLMKEHLVSGARLEKPEKCSEDIYRLMINCWRLQPEDRPTFHECRAELIEIKNAASRP